MAKSLPNNVDNECGFTEITQLTTSITWLISTGSVKRCLLAPALATPNLSLIHI